MELNRGDILGWSFKCSVLGLLGRYDDALASAEKMIQLDPKDSMAWGIRGLALFSMGKLEEGLNSYDKAIELGSKDKVVFFNRAEVLFALNRWQEACIALEKALEQFSQDVGAVAISTRDIVLSLFKTTPEETTWNGRIAALVELYSKYQVLPALGIGIAQSILEWTSPMISDAALRLWVRLWQTHAGKYEEFQIPLRLLDASVRYRETKDPRVLLELPSEERSLLNKLLGIKETQPDEPKPESYETEPTQKGTPHGSRKSKKGVR